MGDWQTVPSTESSLAVHQDLQARVDVGNRAHQYQDQELSGVGQTSGLVSKYMYVSRRCRRKERRGAESLFIDAGSGEFNSTIGTSHWEVSRGLNEH